MHDIPSTIEHHMLYSVEPGHSTSYNILLRIKYQTISNIEVACDSHRTPDSSWKVVNYAKKRQWITRNDCYMPHRIIDMNCWEMKNSITTPSPPTTTSQYNQNKS